MLSILDMFNKSRNFSETRPAKKARVEAKCFVCDHQGNGTPVCTEVLHTCVYRSPTHLCVQKSYTPVCTEVLHTCVYRSPTHLCVPKSYTPVCTEVLHTCVYRSPTHLQHDVVTEGSDIAILRVHQYFRLFYS